MIGIYTDIAVHTPSRVRHDDFSVEKAIKAIARSARGVVRLMPVILYGRIVAWAGWSARYDRLVWWPHKPWMHTWIDRNGLLCGFTNVDDLINQVTNNAQMRQCHWFKAQTTASAGTAWSHFYGVAGFPSAGAWSGTSMTARQHTDAELGAMPHGGNVSTKTKHAINGYARTLSTGVGETYVFVLYDMVISYDQCAFRTTGTNFTNTLTAQRYVGGGDPGLQIMAAANSDQNNIAFSNLTYTAISGTAGQSVSGPAMITPFESTLPSSGFPAITCFTYSNTNQEGVLNAALQPADTGVTKLENLAMGSTVADEANFVLGFQLAWFPIFGGSEIPFMLDLVKQVPSVPQVRDGACLTYAGYMSGSTSLAWNNGLTVAWA